MKKTIIALLVFTTGCATTSPMLQPAVTPPAAWNEPVAASAAPVSADWWRVFDSSELERLVERALAGSPDLAIAMERVRQAEAQVRIAGATLYPGLSLGLDTRTAGSANVASTASVSAAYELDFWGRNAAITGAAGAVLRATAYDRDTLQLTLIAGVANAYFEVLSLRERIALARENLAIAERVLALVQARARGGVVSPLDVARQEAAVLSQRAAILPLEQLERQTLAALAVLVGELPEGFVLEAQGLAQLALPAVSPGLPADLVTRRPDLAAAEAQLAAANANVAAARGALLPSFRLTGTAGAASSALLGFLNGPAVAAALTASMLAPIFDGGRLRAQAEIAESRERELVELYRRAILAAFTDVETSLNAASRLAEREALQAEVEVRAREALRLAEVRYREGADDLLTVLDAQRTLFNAQDLLAQLRLARLGAAVSLYRALGGGWNSGSEPEFTIG